MKLIQKKLKKIYDLSVPVAPASGGTLQLEITLNPINPPIQIPAIGGSFQYTLNITNIRSSPATFDAWTNITLPNGNIYPVLARNGLTLVAGASLNRTMTQNVPASAPAGNYTYNGYVGTNPMVVLDSSNFSFVKLAGDGIPELKSDWSSFGWDETMVSSEILPSEITLHPACPNHFNSAAILSFDLPKEGEISLAIYSIQGKKIVQLLEGWQSAGSHQMSFEAGELSSGVYFAFLSMEGIQKTQKLILLK